MRTSTAASPQTVAPQQRHPQGASCVPTPDGSSFIDLREGVRFAMSWSELEGWIERAAAAHRSGGLATNQLEELVDLAIDVSRQVPEG